jgi:hypothetical protein
VYLFLSKVHPGGVARLRGKRWRAHLHTHPDHQLDDPRSPSRPVMPISSTSTSAASSVPLNRQAREEVTTTKPPVWAIDSTETVQDAPLQAKCARHVQERHGVCCKELKPDDERQLIDPDVVRDAVIGLSVSAEIFRVC